MLSRGILLLRGLVLCIYCSLTEELSRLKKVSKPSASRYVGIKSYYFLSKLYVRALKFNVTKRVFSLF